LAEAARAGMGVIVMKTMAGVYWDRERTQPINAGAALKWALREPWVHTAIPGMTTYEQLEENLKAVANLALTTQERTDLRLMEPQRVGALFCHQCGACLGSCPRGVNIPLLMRSFMYLQAYGDAEKARHTWADGAGAPLPCTRCSPCQARCVRGVSVASAVAAMRGLGAATMLLG
jgi:predicted aldo/keto reductase-like oxidoreductase